MAEHRMQQSVQATNLADILERVLDKGIVIAGDISISLVDIELLKIKVRLLVASVDKAMEIGINWWESDPFLSSHAKKLEEENRLLYERLDRLESTFSHDHLIEENRLLRDRLERLEFALSTTRET